MLQSYRHHFLTKNNPNSRSYSDTCKCNRMKVYRLCHSTSIFLSIFLREILPDPFHKSDPCHCPLITLDVHHSSIILSTSHLLYSDSSDITAQSQTIAQSNGSNIAAPIDWILFSCTGNIFATNFTRLDPWDVSDLVIFDHLGCERGNGW